MIVKGLRVISDFEWEFQMNQLNRMLAPEIETIYVMASPQVQLRLVERREGDRLVRRKGGRAGAGQPSRAASRSKFPNGRPGAPENPRE